MGCCHDRSIGQPIFDGNNFTELKLGLSDISIDAFEKLLRGDPDQNPRWLALEDLGTLFKDFNFGKLILTQEDTDLKILLCQPLFQQEKDEIDRLHVFSLGLLLAHGSNRQKVDALYSTFDSNGNGVLYSTSIKKILYDVLFIATVLIPGLAGKRNFVELEMDFKDELYDMLDQIIRRLFRNELQITKETMKSKFDSELKYIFKGQELRARLQRRVFLERAKTNQQETALMRLSSS